MLIITDIRSVWEDIKDKIDECLIGQDLTREEVYHMCRADQATLMTCEEGFVVIKIVENKNTLFKELLILVGYGKGEVFNKYMPQLIDIAERTGCRKVVFVSNRQGYERKLPSEWKRKFTLFELEI